MQMFIIVNWFQEKFIELSIPTIKSQEVVAMAWPLRKKLFYSANMM